MDFETPEPKRKGDNKISERTDELTIQIKALSPEDVAKIILRLQDDLAVALNKLRYAEFTDKLTKLTSKEGFRVALEDAIREFQDGKIFCVVNLDIIDFKKINETFGHPEGDRALVWAGNQLADLVRENDIAARIGGDEYAIILKDVNEENSHAVMERLKNNMEQNKQLNKDDPVLNKVNFRFAVKEWNKDDTLEKFISDIDLAMYQEERGISDRNVL